MKDPRVLKFREILENESCILRSINGYEKLKKRINDASVWDEYMALLAQIDVTLWFNCKNMIKEIEPELPHRVGFADILLYHSNCNIYCEVYSLESLFKSKESDIHDTNNRIITNNLHNNLSFSEQEIEYEKKRRKIIRNLLEKSNKQLPSGYPGIIALETGRAMVFHFDVKEIAEKLFVNRPQLSLIMLWSLERGSTIGEKPFWFINNASIYLDISYELLKHLKQEHKIIS